jgi:hypothetical protein
LIRRDGSYKDLDGKTTGTGVHESQSRSQWALIDCVDRTPGGAAFACCCDCRRPDNYRPPRSGLPVSNIPTKKADSSSIINHLARRGFIQPGAYKGSRISWTNSYIGERIAWGIITADMSGASEGWFHIQLGQLDQQITLIARPRHIGGRQWYFLCPSNTAGRKKHNQSRADGDLPHRHRMAASRSGHAPLLDWVLMTRTQSSLTIKANAASNFLPRNHAVAAIKRRCFRTPQGFMRLRDRRVDRLQRVPIILVRTLNV